MYIYIEILMCLLTSDLHDRKCCVFTSGKFNFLFCFFRNRNGYGFDIITLNQLLYGLKYPMNIIREASRLLKPGGILYINTPHSDSLAMRIYRGRHCHILWKADLNVFNKQALSAAAERTGLSIKSFYTEWTNLYIVDLLTYFLFRGKFVHRRNSFFPFYRKICSLEEFLQAFVFGNRFEKNGDYCVCILTKDGS